MEIKPRSFYTVRFNDCDPFSHLNNSKYIDYFLNAREDHLKASYGIDLKEWARQGHTFVVSRHEIQYIRPVTYNELICIQSTLIGMGETTLQVEMLMMDKEAQNLRSILWTTFTRVDAGTGKRSVHPQAFLDQFGQLMAPDIDSAKGIDIRISALLDRPLPASS
jgi:acyl-CoA thioester hydrolase